MTEKSQSPTYVVAPRINRFLILSPMSLDEQRELREGVQKLKGQYSKLPGLDTHFQFDTEKGITGSNLPYIVLANMVLAEKGKRTPAFWEAMQLKKGILTNGVYRDYGLALYDGSNPNSELAEGLVKLAKENGFELPVLIHPLSLHPNKKNGVYTFDRDDSLIISGEDAKQELSKFNFVGNSGVRGLGRVNGGGWGAGWGDLLDSGSNGRVDWSCAEGTQKNLEAQAIR